MSDDEHLLYISCIERKFFGGREDVTLDNFCRYVVQDYDVGLRIARELLGTPADSYVYNEDDPEFREVFECAHGAALKAQIKDMEGEL